VFLSPLRIVRDLVSESDVRWYGLDAEGRRVDLAERFMQGWHVLAVSGGRPITLFGLWDGSALLPLSFFYGDGFYECFDAPSPGLRCVG